MTDLMRINSLLRLDLGLDADTGTMPESGPDIPENPPLPEDKSKPKFWKSYETMIDNFNKGLSNHRIEMSRPILWRCTFLLPSATICETVNGFMTGTRVVRKTCSRCKRPRSNSLTLVQEMIREHLIEEIMDFDDCSYQAAIEKYNNAT